MRERGKKERKKKKNTLWCENLLEEMKCSAWRNFNPALSIGWNVLVFEVLPWDPDLFISFLFFLTQNSFIISRGFIPGTSLSSSSSPSTSPDALPRPESTDGFRSVVGCCWGPAPCTTGESHHVHNWVLSHDLHTTVGTFSQLMPPRGPGRISMWGNKDVSEMQLLLYGGKWKVIVTSLQSLWQKKKKLPLLLAAWKQHKPDVVYHFKAVQASFQCQSKGFFSIASGLYCSGRVWGHLTTHHLRKVNCTASGQEPTNGWETWERGGDVAEKHMSLTLCPTFTILSSHLSIEWRKKENQSKDTGLVWQDNKIFHWCENQGETFEN